MPWVHTLIGVIGVGMRGVVGLTGGPKPPPSLPEVKLKFARQPTSHFCNITLGQWTREFYCYNTKKVTKGRLAGYKVHGILKMMTSQDG